MISLYTIMRERPGDINENIYVKSFLFIPIIILFFIISIHSMTRSFFNVFNEPVKEMTLKEIKVKQAELKQLEKILGITKTMEKIKKD